MLWPVHTVWPGPFSLDTLLISPTALQTLVNSVGGAEVQFTVLNFIYFFTLLWPCARQRTRAEVRGHFSQLGSFLTTILVLAWNSGCQA